MTERLPGFAEYPLGNVWMLKGHYLIWRLLVASSCRLLCRIIVPTAPTALTHGTAVKWLEVTNDSCQNNNPLLSTGRVSKKRKVNKQAMKTKWKW
jgi:hypothetical protein